MPNWCFTDLEFRGKDAVKFWEMLERARYRSCKTDDGGSFGKYWLGHYLIGAGISKDDATYGSGKFDCRGSIDSDCIDDAVQGDVVCIKTSTAWGPKIEMFRHLAYISGVDVTIHYYAEEGGEELYRASDDSMTDGGHYYVDSCIYKEDLESLSDEQRAICEALKEPGFWTCDMFKPLFNKLFGASPASFDELMTKFLGIIEDDDIYDEDETYLRVHKIDFDDEETPLAVKSA